MTALHNAPTQTAGVSQLCIVVGLNLFSLLFGNCMQANKESRKETTLEVGSDAPAVNVLPGGKEGLGLSFASKQEHTCVCVCTCIVGHCTLPQ